MHPKLGFNGKTCGLIGYFRNITERKRAEEALRESEQKYSVIFDKAPYAAALAKLPGGVFVEVNEEFIKTLGYSRAEAIGRTSLELGMYPDAEVRRRSAASVDAQGFVRNAEMRLRTKTGELRGFLVSTDMIEIGGKKFVLTTTKDITERKRAEEALRQNEAKYRALVDTMQEGLSIQDENGVITFMNKRGCEMLGYELEELLGMPTTFVFDEENRKVLREQIQKRRKGERQSYEIAWLRKDGGKVDTITAPSPRFDEKGNLVESVAVFTDITERKRAEQALRESEARFRALTESTTAAIFIYQGERFAYVNPSSLELTGYSEEELLGMRFWDIVLPEYVEEVKTRGFAR